LKFPKKTYTEKLFDKISGLRGRDKIQRGAALWIKSAVAELDLKRQRGMVRVANNTASALKKAFPELGHSLLDETADDIASLWNLRKKLDDDLNRLFDLRFPRHYNHLRSLLVDIEVRQLDEGTYLINRLRKRISKLIRALDRRERASRPRREKGPTPGSPGGPGL